jgi:hypothetical protein
MRAAGLILCVLAIALVPMEVKAQERAVDGAGGALAGVLVAGPIGALAGGVIGVVSGPDIARGMGLKGRHHYHRVHYHAH